MRRALAEWRAESRKGSRGLVGDYRVQITDYRERQTKRQLGRDAVPTLPETILDATRHN
jgi:hypothetical protein